VLKNVSFVKRVNSSTWRLVNANNVGVSCRMRMGLPDAGFVIKMAMGIMIIHRVSVLNALLLRSSTTIKAHVWGFNVQLIGHELQKTEHANHVHKVSQSILSTLLNALEQIMLDSAHPINHSMILICINVQIVLMELHLIRRLISVKVRISLTHQISHQISALWKPLTLIKTQELVKSVQRINHFLM